ncbi:hypothetical protein BDZ89DRAFT_151925 [Hymenopellis radicata]|nr:hypothetical protein BDZ89DRAFT_151925 [Hymenopellis radicata]
MHTQTAALESVVCTRNTWSDVCERALALDQVEDIPTRLVQMNNFITSQSHVGAAEAHIDYVVRAIQYIKYVKTWTEHDGAINWKSNVTWEQFKTLNKELVARRDAATGPRKDKILPHTRNFFKYTIDLGRLFFLIAIGIPYTSTVASDAARIFQHSWQWYATTLRSTMMEFLSPNSTLISAPIPCTISCSFLVPRILLRMQKTF